MDKQAEKILSFAGVVVLVWVVVDALLLRHTHLQCLTALLPFTALALGVCWFAALRARLARRAAEERRDRALAQTERPESALFTQDGESFEPFSVGRSQQQFERWLVPTFALALAVALGWTAWRLWAALDHPVAPATNRLVAAALLAAQAFLLFLFSRYLLGLSRPDPQSLLRGPGVALGVACFAALLGAVAAVVAEVAHPGADRWATLILIAALGALAVEGLLNFTWELYRPRRGGELNRAYESRLGGLLTDPAGWVRNIGGALDYQFGFKVSDTWLYRFFEGALLPLVIFQLVTLYLLSALVFLNPEEEGIVERFGRPRATNWKLESGFHLKWPWPFEMVQRHPVKRLLEIEVGYKPHDERMPGAAVDPTLILWNVPHLAEEDQFLVATRDTAVVDEGAAAVPVNLLSFNMAVQYRIKDIREYAYSFAEPEKTLRQMAYRTLTLAAASRDLFELMTGGRDQMAADVRDRLQHEADRRRLGVTIEFVGLKGVHPPVSVAESFQSVIGAVEERAAAILRARAEANRILPVARADAVRLDHEAQAFAARRALVAAAEADLYLKRLDAHAAAPAVFKMRLYLDALQRSLKTTRKYVIATPAGREVMILNFEEKLAPDLFDMGPAPDTR